MRISDWSSDVCSSDLPALDDDRNLPFPFRSARELLTLCERNGLSIAELVRANELANVSEDELQRHLDSIIDTMMDSIDRGMRIEGLLPGRLQVPRRARGIHDRKSTRLNSSH